MAEERNTPPIFVHLTVKGGLEAIEFYARAFGAEEDFKQMADDGKRVLHATLSMFSGHVMLNDEFPEYSPDVMAPPTAGGASITVHVNLDSPAKVDEAMTRAADAGCEITQPAMDAFWGARYGRLRDPFGHIWSFGAELPKQS